MEQAQTTPAMDVSIPQREHMHLIHWCQYDPLTGQALTVDMTGACGIQDIRPGFSGPKCPKCLELGKQEHTCPACGQLVPPCF